MSQLDPNRHAAADAVYDTYQRERLEFEVGLQAAHLDAENRKAVIEGINRRACSPEVSALNDRAELDIYGSKGREYVGPDGQLTTVAGHPDSGIIERIREDATGGKKPKERAAAADKYTSKLEQLLGAGFELCQAKLILDHELKDERVRIDIQHKYLGGGIGAAEAEHKAGAFVTALQTKRRQLIINGGAFTEADYQRLRKGERLYDGNGDYIGQPEPEPAPAVPGQSAQPYDRDAGPTKEDLRRAAMLYDIDEAINEAYALQDFAQKSAVRERSVLGAAKNGSGSRKLTLMEAGHRVSEIDVARSQSEFDKFRWDNHKRVRNSLLAAGLEPEEINNLLRQEDVNLLAAIATETALSKLTLDRLDGDGWWDASRRWVYTKWAEWGGGGGGYFSRGRMKGNLKKMALMAPLGIAGGALAVVASPLLGGVIGAAGVGYAAKLATGLARGMTSARMDRKARSTTRVNDDSTTADASDNLSGLTVTEYQLRRRYQEATAQLIRMYASHTENSDTVYEGPILITEVFAQATRDEVSRNRRRLALAIGTSALGTGFAYAFAALGEHLASSGAVEHIVQHHHHPLKKHHHLSPPKTTSPPTTVQPAGLEPQGQSMNVAPGAGIVNEIQNYSVSRGKNISLQQADVIYSNLLSRLGNNNMQMIVGAAHQPDTYLIGPNDIGISSPGVAYWGPGVEAQLDNLLNSTS